MSTFALSDFWVILFSKSNDYISKLFSTFDSLFFSFLIGELKDLSCSVRGFLAESSVI